MKGKMILNKTLSGALVFTMLSSTIALPQNLVLAEQLSNIQIVEDKEDIGEEVSDTENVEDESQQVSDTENAEDESEQVSDTENIEDESEQVSDTENAEDESEQISDTENIENESQQVSNINTPIEILNNDTQKTSNVESYFNFKDGVIVGFNIGVDVEEIEIPVQINGVDVTEIGENAFKARQVKKLTFAEGSKVKKISKSAFSENPIQGSIQFPSSLEIIEDYAFSGCDGISTIEFKGLKETGKNSFLNCTSLESVTFNEGFEKIGDCSFMNCSNLQSVVFNEGLKEIGKNSFDNCSNLQTVNFPDSLETIGDYAFRGANLNQFTVKNNLKIGNSAFESNKNLSQVTIENGVEYLSAGIFYNCTGLKSVKIPSSVQTIGSSAFGNSGLETLEIEEGVNTIGNSAFSSTKLKSIKIPESVEIIGDYAFRGVSPTEGIYIGNNVKEIGASAFYRYSLYGMDTIKITNFPSNVEIIGNSALAGYWEIDDLTLNNIKSIGTTAFSTTTLGNISITGDFNEIVKQAFKGARTTSSTNLTVNCTNNNGIIREEAFDFYGRYTSSQGLASITLKGIKTLEKNVFTHVNKAGAIELGDTLETIGDNCFSGMEIGSLILSNNLKSIGQYSFSGCNIKSDLSMPQSLESIGYQAFKNASFTNLDLSNVGEFSIGTEAFYMATFGQETLNISSGLKSVNQKAFKDIKGLKTINIDVNKMDIYNESDYINISNIAIVIWKDTKKTNDYVIDADGLLQRYIGNGNDEQLVIPNTIEGIQVKAIAEEIFNKEKQSNLTNIKSIVMPEFLEKINTTYGFSDTFTGIDELYFLYHSKEDIEGTPQGAGAIFWKGTYKDTTGNYVFNDKGEILQYIGKSSNMDIPKQLSYEIKGQNPQSTQTVDIVKIDEKAFFRLENVTSIKIPNTI